jgi:hypothetical protein
MQPGPAGEPIRTWDGLGGPPPGTPVRLGTCGWSFKEWSGVFYARRTKPADYLGYLSQRYPVVEVDIPSPFQNRLFFVEDMFDA